MHIHKYQLFFINVINFSYQLISSNMYRLYYAYMYRCEGH